MIGEYTLKILCDKYNISSENVINKNNNILTYGEYLDIDKTLNYLINELKVSKKNIEKCPSILYRNVDAIKKNIDYLKQQNVSFSSIESCLHILSTEPINLKDTYKYIEENYGIEAINRNTSALSCNKELIIEVEKLELDKEWNLAIAVGITFGYSTLEEVIDIINSEEYKNHPELFTPTTLAHAKIKDIKELLHSDEYKEHPELFTSTTLARAKIKDIKKLLHSDEYKEHPELFTSQTLAYAKIKDIKELLHSEEYKEYPELFTSETLAHAKIKDIKELLHSDEYKEHPELFTSTTLAHAKIKDIKDILHSDEYKEHPELFTSQTLAFAKIKDIKELLHSEEYKEHPELFTSTTLAHAKIKDIKDILHSDEYKEHPELFTSTTLAHAKIKDIKELLHSEEYKEHPELFTSGTLAYAKIKDIKELLHSEEYKEHPELFTSETLARAKIEDISTLLKMPYWSDIRFKHLLTSSVLAKAKQMINKLPVLIKIAEYYEIDEYLTTSFLLVSPIQSFALINYLNDNNIPLIINGKLNSVFGKQPGLLKKKYGIDIKEQMKKYDFSKFDFNEKNRSKVKKNGIR